MPPTSTTMDAGTSTGGSSAVHIRAPAPAFCLPGAHYPSDGSQVTAPTKAGPGAPLCRFFNTPRGCQFGAHCRNRHVMTKTTGSASASTTTQPAATGVTSSSGTNTNASTGSNTTNPVPGGGSKSIPCRYFAAGHCARGDSCWYLHDPSALSGDSSTSGDPPTENSKPDTSLTSTLKASLSSSSSSPSSSSSTPKPAQTGKGAKSTPTPAPEPESCVICFEEKPETYGLLEKCGHAFCLDCIRSWRNPAAKDSPTALSGVIKSCPACRAPSSFITPSRVFYPDSHPMKAVTVKNYKAKLAKIPCKYFIKRPSNPYCPFGFDCFYAHIGPDGEPHIFEHGIEETANRAAERARIRANRARANDLRRVRETLDSVGRMLHDDFGAFVDAMRAEFGDPADWDDDDEDEDEDEDEDDEDEDDDDDDDGEWDTDEEVLAGIADEEERYLAEQWFTERVSMWDSAAPETSQRSPATRSLSPPLPGFVRPR